MKNQPDFWFLFCLSFGKKKMYNNNLRISWRFFLICCNDLVMWFKIKEFKDSLERIPLQLKQWYTKFQMYNCIFWFVVKLELHCRGWFIDNDYKYIHILIILFIFIVLWHFMKYRSSGNKVFEMPKAMNFYD
jgi:hypothetical protein